MRRQLADRLDVELLRSSSQPGQDHVLDHPRTQWRHGGLLSLMVRRALPRPTASTKYPPSAITPSAIPPSAITPDSTTPALGDSRSVQPWTPPSPAMRRLCELQTVRAGLIANRTEWKNRLSSGLGDSTAIQVAKATTDNLTRQLAVIDQAIAETIDQDGDLRARRDLLLSVI